jgi:cell division transport system ATP-binding protein
VIKLYKVSKSFGGPRMALSQIDLQIPRGQFTFLTGHSGAGKTTFLKLIFRELLPTEGHLIVGGRNTAQIPQRYLPFFRRSIGVVFQDVRLLPRKTIFENVSLVLRIQGVPRREQKRRAYKVLKTLGLGHRMVAFPKELSGGEQQRIAIARALINEPKLLLADEPTGNLDPELSLEIMEIFREINSRGTTVVVATHDRGLMEHFTDARRIHLVRGQMADWAGSPGPEPPVEDEEDEATDSGDH